MVTRPEPVARTAGEEGSRAGSRGAATAHEAREGWTIGPSTPARWRVALIVFLATLLTPSIAAASGPYETATGTTRTVEWTMDGPQSLVPNLVSLEPNGAVLSWQAAGFAWDEGVAFSENGTADATVTAAADGLELLADRRNHLTDASFDEGSQWTFENASSGQTTATWNAEVREARFAHESPPSPESQWDPLDSEGGWLGVGFHGSSALSTNTTAPREGTGMLQDIIETDASPSAWAGAMQMDPRPLNWSAYDWLVLWISSPLSPSSVTFNVTAVIRSSPHGTLAEPLNFGWQERTVDLRQLGADRSEITQVTLRFNAPSISRERFYLDDMRLIASKRVDETAEIRQIIDKANATSTTVRNAVIAYDWVIANASGIGGIESFVQVLGPGGTYTSTQGAPVVGTWSHETVDVSGWIGPAGTYEVRVGVRFRVDSTITSNGTVRLDNVSLEYTERSNGTFLSYPVDLGARSDLDSFSWLGATPSGTSVQVALRIGSSPTPGDATWGAWDEWTFPGTYDLPAGRTARYAQVRASLGTMDDTLTPLVSGVELVAGHRALSGQVTTEAFTAGQSLVGWRGFDAGWNATPEVSIEFAISNGSGWAPLAPGVDLQALALGPTIQLRATLSTTDGLATPRLSWMRLSYEVVGGIALGLILTDPIFLALVASGAIAYTGYTVLSRRAYAVEDLFLVARDGRLILHNTSHLRADRDEDIFAGMLTAMSSFVKDTFKEEPGGLRQFAVGGKQVLIERVDSVFLAAIYANRVPRWGAKDLRALAQDLQRQFGARLRAWSGSSEDLQDLRTLTDRFVRKTRYRHWPFPRGAA